MAAAHTASPGSTSVRCVFAARRSPVLPLQHQADEQETADQQKHEEERQQVEVPVDENFDRRAKDPDEAADQEEPSRPPQHGGKQEFTEVDLKDAPGNGRP
jgi:hypothetical protein